MSFVQFGQFWSLDCRFFRLVEIRPVMRGNDFRFVSSKTVEHSKEAKNKFYSFRLIDCWVGPSPKYSALTKINCKRTMAAV